MTSEKKVDVSGWNVHGGNAIGQNTGTVHNTDNSTKVTGMTGGKADTVIAAGQIHGGAGNKGTHYHAEQMTNNTVTGSSGVTTMGNIRAGNNVNVGTKDSTGASRQEDRKDPTTLKSAALLEKVRDEECTEETVKIFEINKITGKLFMDPKQWEKLAKTLNITNPVDIMKLDSLREELNKP